MTQTKDRRPRDWAYQIFFSRRDLPLLMQMTKRIHQTHDMTEVEAMHKKCESILLAGRVLDDDGEDARTFLINDQRIKIEAVNKTEDLAVNVGMQQCINIILGTSATRWRYMQFSQATDPGNSPSVSDTLLELGPSETTLFEPPYNPIDMSGLLGWRESVGMRLLFGGIRSQSKADGTGQNILPIGEVGVLTTNSQATAVLLNRSKFVKNRIPDSHAPDINILNNYVCILSCVIEFCPVA